MTEEARAVLRRIVWLGDSRRNIQAFPTGAQKLIGDELQLVQFGGMPKDAKPFKGIGSGVFEIALAYEANAYRAVYAVQLGRNIYGPARVSEEIKVGHQNAAEGRRPNQAAL